MIHERFVRTAACLFAAGLVLRGGALRAQTPPATSTSEEVVVSATKVPEDPADVAAPVSIISGEELRRRNTFTVADALQDIVGVDTGNGSDNGSRLANIGLGGLKEFDALLVTVDGVPMGGPFNPSLAQIPVEDVDRIEIVRGPQGTLYGVSAFAGMIQVFTRRSGRGGSVSLAGGSFSERRGFASYGMEDASGSSFRVFGSLARGDGWQDRTDFASERLTLSGEKRFGQTRILLSAGFANDRNDWGSPLPVDAGRPIPGFFVDRNYAVEGARQDHRILFANSALSIPLAAGFRLENTLGATRDDQISVRSFIREVDEDGGGAGAEGVAIKPRETTLFDDLRVVAEFAAAGRHRIIGGAAVTWGRTTASGHGFDIELETGRDPEVPDLSTVPPGDDRNFRDRRTFLGFYVNDEWTPVSALTITAGARFDAASERLNVFQQEIGDPEADRVSDSRSDREWSGGVSALYRVLERPAGALSAVNVYAAAKSAFKPAAPNLSEAESARILDPERTRSGEIGIKTRWLDRAVSFDVTAFHMIFENLVVGVPSPTGEPALTNAGKERFQGWEFEGGYHPRALSGLSIYGGYAHHDARFIRFSFFTPEGDLRVVDGKRLELVPRDLWNVKLAYGPGAGPGAFVAVRHQNRRPLNRRNTFWTDSFFETDAGVSWDFSWGRIGVVARNLGDSRHYVADSEIGDSQFYVAPPRRYSAELTLHF